MRHVAAYLLLALGGNATPSADDVKNLLSSVDIEADDAQLTRLISSLEGKDLDQLITSGMSKLAALPVGGAAPAAGGAGAAAGGAAAAAGADAAAKDEESDAGSVAAAGLFGGGGEDDDW